MAKKKLTIRLDFNDVPNEKEYPGVVALAMRRVGHLLEEGYREGELTFDGRRIGWWQREES